MQISDVSINSFPYIDRSIHPVYVCTKLLNRMSSYADSKARIKLISVLYQKYIHNSRGKELMHFGPLYWRRFELSIFLFQSGHEFFQFCNWLLFHSFPYTFQKKRFSRVVSSIFQQQLDVYFPSFQFHDLMKYKRNFVF